MKIFEAINDFEKWRSTKNKSSKKEYEFLRQFALFMKDCHIDYIEESDVTEYATLMKGMGWKVNGMATRMTAIKQFLKYCQMSKYETLSPDLVLIPKKEKTLPYVATDSDYEKLIETIGSHGNQYKKARDLALVGLLKDTGARCGEILTLTTGDLDLEKREAVIRTKKSRGQKPFRQIYWTEEVNNFLKEWLIKRDDFFELRHDVKKNDVLFIATKGGGEHARSAGMPLQVSGVGIMMRTESVRANLPQTVNAHSFRHRMGHLLNEKGANNSTISSILGHSNIESSFVYTELNNHERRKVYKDLIDN